MPVRQEWSPLRLDLNNVDRIGVGRLLFGCGLRVPLFGVGPYLMRGDSS